MSKCHKTTRTKLFNIFLCSFILLMADNSLALDLPAPMPEARVRLYGQNGKPTNMKYSNQGRTVKKSIGGSLGGSFSSMIGTARNRSIGIPATNTLENIRQHNRNLSKIYYEEFTIPANVPIVFSNAIIGLTNINNPPNGTKIITTQPSCVGNKMIFHAEAGKDYEVFPASTSAQCGIIIQEIKPDGSVVPLKAN